MGRRRTLRALRSFTHHHTSLSTLQREILRWGVGEEGVAAEGSVTLRDCVSGSVFLTRSPQVFLSRQYQALRFVELSGKAGGVQEHKYKAPRMRQGFWDGEPGNLGRQCRLCSRPRPPRLLRSRGEMSRRRHRNLRAPGQPLAASQPALLTAQEPLQTT